MAIEVIVGFTEKVLDIYGVYTDQRVQTFVVRKVTGVHHDDERSVMRDLLEIMSTAQGGRLDSFYLALVSNYLFTHFSGISWRITTDLGYQVNFRHPDDERQRSHYRPTRYQRVLQGLRGTD